MEVIGLKLARFLAGVSQRRLGEVAGCSQFMVHQIEAGTAAETRKVAEVRRRISEFLQVDPKLLGFPSE